MTGSLDPNPGKTGQPDPVPGLRAALAEQRTYARSLEADVRALTELNQVLREHTALQHEMARRQWVTTLVLTACVFGMAILVVLR